MSVISTYLVSFFLSVAVFQLLPAQGPYAGTSKLNHDSLTFIRWINQYPSVTGKSKNKKIKDRISDAVFGSKDPVLSKPMSVFALNPDSYWVLDQGNGSIIRVEKELAEIPKLLKKKNVSFISLVGICRNNKGDLLFTDSYQNKIYVYNHEKKDLHVLNDSLKLEQPTGIAFSGANNEIWVVETAAHRVSVLNEKGEMIRQIGKRGVEAGEYNFPTFLWIDAGGEAYIVDAMNFRVQILNKSGEYVSSFGTAGDASGYFARPKGIATDSHGNIYIADALFNTIQIFDKSGNFLWSFGSQGRDAEQFWMPCGIYIDGNDYIYIADSYNSRVQVFQLINRN